MCQDPNHLFLAIQILTKIWKMRALFLLYLIALTPLLTLGEILSFVSPKFRENAKDPARIPEPWIQNPKRIFAHFLGIKLFHR